MGREKRTFSHNDINIFQPNEIKPDENGVTRGMMYPAPPVPDGTGIEWYAEKDVYVVMSNCPYADQASPLPEAKPNPMYIIVYETGIAPETDAGSTVGPIRLLRTSCNDTSAQAGFLQEDVSLHRRRSMSRFGYWQSPQHAARMQVAVLGSQDLPLT